MSTRMSGKITLKATLKKFMKSENYGLLIIVPLIVYLVLITGNYTGMKLKMLIIDSVIISIFMTITHYILRLKKLKFIFNNLDSDDEKILRKIKSEVLGYARFDARIVVMRWLLAIPLLLIMLYFQVDLDYHNVISLSGIPLIIPFSYILFYTCNENFMSDILENEGLKNVIVDKTEYPHFSLINRVFLLTVSIALIPLGILGFFIHLINTNQLVLTHLGWHMIFIFLLSAIAIIVSLHEMKISTNRSVLTVESALGSIRQGDLTIKSIPMLSANELGSISQFVNALLNQLKEIVLNVKSTSDTVYTSALDINSASQGLSASANEQAAGVEEISSTIEEMFSSVTQNAEHSNEADKLSEGSLNLSGEGTKVVEKAVSSIHEVNQFGTKISDIISLINDIAFQTNLLALNASVEAARAGESGRGFAVVASEVRNLAQRSRTASDEIGKLIKETIEKVETGTELVNESGKSLSAIYNSAKQVRNIISELNVANQEQKAGLGQISAAINQAETTTQETASAAEELASTAENLKQNSVELQHLISYFRI